MRIGQVVIKVFLGFMLLTFLAPPPGFATCGLFDFSFHIKSKHEKQVEKKPPALTISPEMNKPRITIQKEMHVRETPTDNK